MAGRMVTTVRQGGHASRDRVDMHMRACRFERRALQARKIRPLHVGARILSVCFVVYFDCLALLEAAAL
jgi:hypothetical protein